jgi:hypothetical protein
MDAGSEMTVATAPRRRAVAGRRRVVPRRHRAAPPRRIDAFQAGARRPLALDTITEHWQLGLDAAERALGAAEGFMPAAELQQRRSELVRERQHTAELLRSLATLVVRLDP